MPNPLAARGSLAKRRLLQGQLPKDRQCFWPKHKEIRWRSFWRDRGEVGGRTRWYGTKLLKDKGYTAEMPAKNWQMK